MEAWCEPWTLILSYTHFLLYYAASPPTKSTQVMRIHVQRREKKPFQVLAKNQRTALDSDLGDKRVS